MYVHLGMQRYGLPEQRCIRGLDLRIEMVIANCNEVGQGYYCLQHASRSPRSLPTSRPKCHEDPTPSLAQTSRQPDRGSKWFWPRSTWIKRLRGWLQGCRHLKGWGGGWPNSGAWLRRVRLLSGATRGVWSHGWAVAAGKLVC